MPQKVALSQDTQAIVGVEKSNGFWFKVTSGLAIAVCIGGASAFLRMDKAISNLELTINNLTQTIDKNQQDYKAFTQDYLRALGNMDTRVQAIELELARRGFGVLGKEGVR